MNAFRWEMQRIRLWLLMDRIRMTGINHPTPPTSATATVRNRLSTADVWRGDRIPPPPPDEEAAGVDAVAREDDHIAGVETLLLDEAAPPFRQNVALAAVPVGVPESPRFPQFILEP